MIGSGRVGEIEGGAAAVGRPRPDRFSERFRLWTGRSGRRYVFSRVDGGCDDLDGAVVAIGRERATGEIAIDRVIEDGARIDRRLPAENVVFAHFLAETAAARRAVVADLGRWSASGPIAGEG